MSELNERQVEEMHAYFWDCHSCGQTITKGFCGRCDEYYNIGHASGCKNTTDRDDHRACKNYVHRGVQF